ncbi:transcriptional regulator [Lacticaseibacillus rhamnosus MTCC 5462]|nr:transcriptional regulator [Lacticaseibacillus rhamnosus MTCC 5462]
MCYLNVDSVTVTTLLYPPNEGTLRTKRDDQPADAELGRENLEEHKEFTETTSTDMDAFFAEMMQDSSYRKLAESEKAKLASAYAVLEARQNAGLSQQELANKSGVPKTTIARIERGSNTSIETLTKIANALGKQVKVSIV